VIEAARSDAQKEIEALQAEARELRRKLQAAALPLTALKEIEAAAEDLAAAAEQPVIPAPAESLPNLIGPKKPIRLGETVWLANLKTEGVVLALTAAEAEVQVGRLRIKAKLDELQTSKSQISKPQSLITNPQLPLTHNPPPPRPTTGMEIDIRGQTVEDGLMLLERYLESAYGAQLPWVRIIHGKGTGKLRQAVRELLKASDLVASHESGGDTEGGEGVTIARLAVA
jgi:DNA mismatch repair protein MutS2